MEGSYISKPDLTSSDISALSLPGTTSNPLTLIRMIGSVGRRSLEVKRRCF
jgi:hypothetical protein